MCASEQTYEEGESKEEVPPVRNFDSEYRKGNGDGMWASKN